MKRDVWFFTYLMRNLALIAFYVWVMIVCFVSGTFIWDVAQDSFPQRVATALQEIFENWAYPAPPVPPASPPSGSFYRQEQENAARGKPPMPTPEPPEGALPPRR